MLNALAAMAIAHGRGIPREAIEEALATFRGVTRRMQVRGEVGGVLSWTISLIIPRPSATIEAARGAGRGAACGPFSSRAPTPCAAKFSGRSAEALALGDLCLLGGVYRAQQLAEEERLDPRRSPRSSGAGQGRSRIARRGRIAESLAAEAKPGDMVLVLSNGSFDGLCEKLSEMLVTRHSLDWGRRSVILYTSLPRLHLPALFLSCLRASCRLGRARQFATKFAGASRAHLFHVTIDDPRCEGRCRSCRWLRGTHFIRFVISAATSQRVAAIVNGETTASRIRQADLAGPRRWRHQG